MRLIVPLSLFALALPAAAWADSPKWVVDTSKSTLSFSGSQGGKEFKGSFAHFTPEIEFAPDKLDAAKIKVTIDTASAATGDKVYDGSLPGPEWFNTTKFPQATFVATGFKSLGTDKDGITLYQTTGKLTILGIEKEVILPFSLKTEGTNTHATGNVVIKRLDYGLGIKPDGKGEWVSNDIHVSFDILAHQ